MGTVGRESIGEHVGGGSIAVRAVAIMKINRVERLLFTWLESMLSTQQGLEQWHVRAEGGEQVAIFYEYEHRRRCDARCLQPSLIEQNICQNAWP